MIQTKNLEELLDKKYISQLLIKYQKECFLSDKFQIQNIKRQLVLSPKTYAILYEVLDQGKIRKIRVNASQEETRIRAYKVMKFLENKYSGPVYYIPKACFYNKDYNLVAYENVDGKTFVNQFKDNNLEQKIELVSQWIKKLHSIVGFDSLDLPEHEIRFNFKALKKNYPELAEKGPSLVKELKSNLENEDKKLIHGDYQPNNIIISNERIAVIDLNDSQIAYPSFDLAKLITQLRVMLFRFADTKNYEELKKIFLKNYQLDYNKNNFITFTQINYFQILCSLSASLAEEPEAEETLSEIYKYWKESNV